jgi:pilus assembly protein Flp/PilA
VLVLIGRTPKWKLLTFVQGVFIMVKFVTSFLRDESGASAAEYALILAIVGSTIAFAAVTLGGSISGALTSASNCIDNPPATAGAACTS